MYMYMQFRTSY